MPEMFPPVPLVGVTTRHLVEAGCLLQRELVSQQDLGSAGRLRGLPTSPSGSDVWERWDHDGVLCPLAFYIGFRQQQHIEGDYPAPSAARDAADREWVQAGYVFRDEVAFRPWSHYAFTTDDGTPHAAKPLYSEWQLLALPLVTDSSTIAVPIELLAGDREHLADWASGIVRRLAQMHIDGRTTMHTNWLPTIKILLRLQARYWPHVSGSSKLLYTQGPKQDGDRPVLDALRLEHQQSTAEEALEQLGVSTDDLAALAEWLTWRAQSGVDPQPHLHDLMRLLPRRRAEQARDRARQALDLYDALELVRRFHFALTDRLLPDADQRDTASDVPAPRSLRKDHDALVEALQSQRLTAHKLHIIVEGETEVRLVRGLFEAFSGQTLSAAGIAMTDLEGDKLEGSRRFIEGLGLYARDIVLLLDDENDAQRVVQRMVETGVLKPTHAKLVSPSLEEANFSPNELVAMANSLGSAHGVELSFTGADLAKQHSERNQRPGVRPLGMASMLVRMAKNPSFGPVLQIRKPDLAQPMLALLLAEIRSTPGRHIEVAARRPIVDWMLRFPLQAARIP